MEHPSPPSQEVPTTPPQSPYSAHSPRHDASWAEPPSPGPADAKLGILLAAAFSFSDATGFRQGTVAHPEPDLCVPVAPAKRPLSDEDDNESDDGESGSEKSVAEFGVDDKRPSAKRKRASPDATMVLNSVLTQTFFPDTELRLTLARKLGMTPRKVQIWFQNRRQALGVTKRHLQDRTFAASAKQRVVEKVSKSPSIKPSGVVSAVDRSASHNVEHLVLDREHVFREDIAAHLCPTTSAYLAHPHTIQTVPTPTPPTPAATPRVWAHAPPQHIQPQQFTWEAWPQPMFPTSYPSSCHQTRTFPTPPPSLPSLSDHLNVLPQRMWVPTHSPLQSDRATSPSAISAPLGERLPGIRSLFAELEAKSPLVATQEWDLSSLSCIFSDIPERDGESCIMRHKSTPFGTPLKNSPDGKTFTTWEVFQAGKAKSGPDGPYFGVREYGIKGGPYVWQSYATVEERIRNVGSGILEITGIQPHSESCVGIYMGNCPEWAITDLAGGAFSVPHLRSQSYVTVPLYETFDSKAIKHIISITSMSLIVTTRKHLVRLLDIRTDIPTVTCIVLCDPSNSVPHSEELYLEPDEVAEAKSKGVTLITFRELEDLGSRRSREFDPAEKDELQTICFTSGTTGLPKGAMLTQNNWVAGLSGIAYRYNPFVPGDRWISYLPLAHCFEKIDLFLMTYVGGAGGFFRGDVGKLFDDMEELKPAYFPSVPRLLNKFYEKTIQSVEKSGLVNRTLFNTAMEYKKTYLNEGIATSDTWADRLVFSGIRNKLGGDLKMVITGSAPIPHDVVTFLRATLGSCQVLEGYGQTENAACFTLTEAGDFNFPFGSHVGCPSPHAEMKLIDVPELNYFATDRPGPRGEICYRGRSMMKGYYKDPKQTADAIDENGWLHSGGMFAVLGRLKNSVLAEKGADLRESEFDLCMGTFACGKTGNVKIIDRRKNIFKLSQGEYIAAEKVENTLQKSGFVSQIFVYGDSLQSFLVAVIVPDPEVLIDWAKSTGYTPLDAQSQRRDARRRSSIFEASPPATDFASSIDEPAAGMTSEQRLYAKLCQDKNVASVVLDDLRAIGRANELHGFEVPRAVYLESKPFTMEADLLTPTVRDRRAVRAY
ncbi:hypothetical protein HDU93_006166 [Gonapodya sp. JEL0774]|nr:hypothetical protein HDU93_006166 [Gonapodya sp. JEL0774]